MKTLYIDCSMGAAGDMLTAALLELLPDREAFVARLNSLGIPGVRYSADPAVKCGITGTHVSVTVDGEEEDEHLHEHEHHHDHEHHHEHEHEHEHGHDHSHDHAHHHSSLHDIEHIVTGHLSLPTMVALDVMAVYQEIAEAESHVHGRPVDQIHFHEVGTMDAVADIVAVCLLMHKLKPDEVVVSPIHVGSGQVHCAHGILPVPAPATAYILRNIPTYGGNIQGELCTPTGAALLKHFATRFGSQPMMSTQAIGYGMGKKDFPQANCVRAMIGEKTELPASPSLPQEAVSVTEPEHTASCEDGNTVIELSCNVDDMTAEAVAFAMEKFLSEGANEVYTVPAGMKKSRPGILLRMLCKPSDREKMVKLIFANTTTIGIRELTYQRYVLDRKIETIDTSFGPVRRKVSSGYGVTRVKFEYEDLARIAKEHDLSLEEVEKRISLGGSENH
ncbi:MAG: nickel pincer cofactor biosynthesis protein LarC [Clostridiales bacterium]|nr:nickel pincer cofactor biosynthesis protein LarC [Clostridiales bacterium]